ncbi:hypothetical protein RAS1_15720 [Phycisphaerae bacterium RAS1]|nr:hypothetical protein RAS1_15720 [Phycisphaerae bacterium RAS1]
MALIREPAVAGRFYPSDANACISLVDKLLEPAAASAAVGGLAPHAGWLYSGSTAALTIKCLAASNPETIVVFGAVHVWDRNTASLFGSGTWRTPIGDIEVDRELCRELARTRLITVAPEAHRDEHSIEVELPFIKRLLPSARIVPLMVQPSDKAAEIGRVVAVAAGAIGREVAYIASTDLTHYGPAYGFEPMGRGVAGVRWAKDVNDQRFIRTVGLLDPHAVVPEATTHRNACGAGAVAALLGAVTGESVTLTELLHTCSAEIAPERNPENSVGYVSAILS